MKPVTIIIVLGSVWQEAFKPTDTPVIRASVFVDGLGVIDMETGLSKELADQLERELVAVVRQRLGMKQLEAEGEAAKGASVELQAEGPAEKEAEALRKETRQG